VFFIRISNALQQGLQLKISALETESKENMERMQEDILKKSEEIDVLQKERMKIEQNVDSFDKEVLQLRNVLEEKDQCIMQHKEQEKKLEDQITEVLEQRYSARCNFLTVFVYYLNFLHAFAEPVVINCC
jgi:septal ring factor EnvC (AmiA/AmiB activator)